MFLTCVTAPADDGRTGPEQSSRPDEENTHDDGGVAYTVSCQQIISSYSMTRVIHTPETLNVSLLFTFTGMTALDVSGDADNSECVDAAQTKNKSEEPIHLTNKQTNHIHQGKASLFI